MNEIDGLPNDDSSDVRIASLAGFGYFGCSNDTFATKSVEVTTPSFGKGVLQRSYRPLRWPIDAPGNVNGRTADGVVSGCSKKRHSSYLDVREPPRLAKNAVPQSTPAAPSIKVCRKAATVGDATSGNDRYVFDRIDNGRDSGPEAKCHTSPPTAPRQRCPPLRRSNGGRSSGYSRMRTRALTEGFGKLAVHSHGSAKMHLSVNRIRLS